MPESGAAVESPAKKVAYSCAPITLVVVAASLLWAYWPALESMARKWESDPQYSHGFLVVPFSLFLLWTRREHRASTLAQPGVWGLLMIAAGAGLHLLGAWFYFDWIEHVSLLPCLAGLALLTGGSPALKWSWPAIAFLVFMVPLPHRVETALAGTLQRITSSSSAAVLNTLDRPTVAEGNVLTVNGEKVEIVAACSGLGSLLVFFAMATAVAILSGRPLLDRALLVISAVPIALATNVIRVTATVLLKERFGNYAGFETFHELAGWFMMAIALGILCLELWLLRLLFLPAPAAPVGGGNAT